MEAPRLVAAGVLRLAALYIYVLSACLQYNAEKNLPSLEVFAVGRNTFASVGVDFAKNTVRLRWVQISAAAVRTSVLSTIEGFYNSTADEAVLVLKWARFCDRHVIARVTGTGKANTVLHAELHRSVVSKRKLSNYAKLSVFNHSLFRSSPVFINLG